jgi:hypothetical protein
MIAHRLSTLERCDLIIRIEGGRCRTVEWNRSDRQPTLRDKVSQAEGLGATTSPANTSPTIPAGRTEQDDAQVGVGADRTAAVVTPEPMGDTGRTG